MKNDYLHIYCYDISQRKMRARVVARLSERAVRVQQSVFEARLTTAAGARLARACAAELQPGDSLRVYVVTRAGLSSCLTFGATPPVTDADYLLL